VPLLLFLDMVRLAWATVSVCLKRTAVLPGDWYLPVIQNLGHAYVAWYSPMRIYYTRPQLERLHRYLLHPSAWNLLSKTAPCKAARSPSGYAGSPGRDSVDLPSLPDLRISTHQLLDPKAR
jgi:hypothetical protein